MNRKWGIALISIGVLLLIVTIGSYFVQKNLAGVFADYGKVVDEGKQTVDLANINMLEIDNPMGRTHVKADPDAKQVTIAYQKRVAGGVWGFGSSKSAADDVKITIENNKSGGRLALDTIRPNSNWLTKEISVDYDITVPPTLELNIQSVVGPIETNGMKAPVTAHNTTGSITIDGYKGKAVAHLTTGRIDIRGAADGNVAVDAETTTGSVSASLPSDANVSVTASTTTGGISSAFSDLERSIRKNVPGATLNGRTGTGSDGQLELHAVTGSIEINKD